MLIVADDDETVASRLCSCRSTSASFERGLEGTLDELRGLAMLGAWGWSFDAAVKGRKEQEVIVCLCPILGFSIYNREADAMA